MGGIRRNKIFSEEKWMKAAVCSRSFVLIFSENLNKWTVFLFLLFFLTFQCVEWPFRLLGMWGLDFTPSCC